MRGIGAHAAGGRWNSPGHYVVYASGNISLAILELLVHVDDGEQARELPLAYHSITFPPDALALLTDEDVPGDWESRPETAASQMVGDEWLESRSSVVLAVPSVITPARHRYVPEYMNYMINPLHPDFGKAIEVGEILDLALDSRLL